jgi:hypothetical protein
MSTIQRFDARDKGRERPKTSGHRLFESRRIDGPRRHTAAGHVLDPDDPGAPSPEAVREQLQRVVDSPVFEASERRKRFLRYVVEEMLAGRADRLKGYAIATAVFDRDDTFDPQTDPVVRLEARRLRRALEHYYLTAGRDDPIRIEIPKGGYTPICERQGSASGTPLASAGAHNLAAASALPPRQADPGGTGSLQPASPSA